MLERFRVRDRGARRGRRGRGGAARGARGRASGRLSRRRRDARRRPVLRAPRPGRSGGSRRRSRATRRSLDEDLREGGEADAKAFDDLADDPQDDDAARRPDQGEAGPLRRRPRRRTSSGKPGSKFVSVAKQMQDILGGHQDAVVAQARIRDWAASSFTPESGFAAGRLVQLERDRDGRGAARLAGDCGRSSTTAARRAAR